MGTSSSWDQNFPGEHGILSARDQDIAGGIPQDSISD
jgi:hypothetical protein